MAKTDTPTADENVQDPPATPPAPPEDTQPSNEPAAPVTANRRGKAAEPRVSYRVLKKGDGQVFTGDVDPETGLPETFSKGDQVDDVPLSIAQALEDRDFVEILGA